MKAGHECQFLYNTITTLEIGNTKWRTFVLTQEHVERRA